MSTLNINLVYTGAVTTVEENDINISLDANIAPGYVPVMLREKLDCAKNLNLHAVLAQISLIKAQFDNNLLRVTKKQDLNINVVNTRLFGGYLHMQIFTFLKELGIEENISLQGYPEKWESELVIRATKVAEKEFCYLAKTESPVETVPVHTDSINIT